MSSVSVVSYPRAGGGFNFSKRLSFTLRDYKALHTPVVTPPYARGALDLWGALLSSSGLVGTLTHLLESEHSAVCRSNTHMGLTFSMNLLGFLQCYFIFCCLFSYSRKTPEKVPLTLIVFSPELPLYILESLHNNSESHGRDAFSLSTSYTIQKLGRQILENFYLRIIPIVYVFTIHKAVRQAPQ